MWLSAAKAPIGSGDSSEGKGFETPRERHCGRKDAPKRREPWDESPPLGEIPRRQAADVGHKPCGASQENCTEED